jgi:hypothetical protein
VRIVVLTVTPSSWMVIGSSTTSSSGRRAVAPSCTLVTSTVSLRPRAAIAP